MKKLTLILFMSFLAVSFLIVGAPSPSSADGPFVFKYANTQSENHPRSLSMVYFKNLVEKASQGRITVELYFSGVLGKDSEILDMVKQGLVQGTRGGLFDRANKRYMLYTLPFMFENAESVMKVVRSDFGKEIDKGALANGFYVPATGIAGGMRNMTCSKRPVEKVEDLKGLKMRLPPDEMSIQSFKALGANPVNVAFTETYMALKTKVVDAQENPFSNIVDMKFYEPQEYLSLINWQVRPDPLCVNPAWYNSLPDDLKAIFDASAEAALIYSDTIWLNSEAGFFNFLEKKLKVNEITPENRKEFVEKTKSVWDSYVKQGYFTQEDIDKMLEIAKK